MTYALFSEDSKLSKAYPSEADVWKVARDNGLVTDVATADPTEPPRQILDHNYEIRACECEPGECPDRNRAEASADEPFLEALQGR